MNGFQKVFVILGGIALAVALIVTLENNRQERDTPDTVTKYTKHLCATRGGEWLRSSWFGYMCKVKEMQGRFDNGYSWYQFFYSVENHDTGEMNVKMYKLTGSPDSPYVMRESTPVAAGSFIHRGGNHNE